MVNVFPERIVPGTDEFKLYYADHIKRYMFTIPYIEDKNVLDIACGVGYGSYYMASNGAKKVLGGDISKETIEYAKANYKLNDNLKFIVADALNLASLDEKFDVVVSMETFEHLTDQRKFLEEVTSVLNDDGVFIVSTPLTTDPDKKPLNPFHVKEVGIAEFQKILTVNFEKVDLYGERITDKRRKQDKDILIHFMAKNHNFAQIARLKIFSMVPQTIKKSIKKPKNISSSALHDRSVFLSYLLENGYAYTVDDYTISRNNIAEAHVIMAVCMK